MGFVSGVGFGFDLDLDGDGDGDVGGMFWGGISPIKVPYFLVRFSI